MQVFGIGASLERRLFVKWLLERRWGEGLQLGGEGWRSALAPWRRMPNTVKGGFLASKRGAVLGDVESRSPLLLRGAISNPILLPRGGVLLWQ